MYMEKNQTNKNKLGSGATLKKIEFVKTSKINQSKKDQNTVEVLSDIHKKINSSAALNGGFDLLMFKIEKIEQNQESLVGKLDKIHEAIYDPDDGIFSKINVSTIDTIKKINQTDHSLVTILEWKNRKEKDEEKNEESFEEATTKLSSLQVSVESLQKSKNTLSDVLRWILVALMGGSLTLAFKWLENKF